MSISFTCLCFLFNILGCSIHSTNKKRETVIDVYGHITSKHKVTNVKYIQLCSKIRRVITKRNETYQVDSSGIKIDTTNSTMVFSTMEKKQIYLKIKEVQYLQSENENYILFNKNGGRIDFGNYSINGQSPDNTHIEISLDEICHINGLTINSNIGLIIIGGVLGIIVILGVIEVSKRGTNVGLVE